MKFSVAFALCMAVLPAFSDGRVVHSETAALVRRQRGGFQGGNRFGQGRNRFGQGGNNNNTGNNNTGNNNAGNNNAGNNTGADDAETDDADNAGNDNNQNGANNGGNNNNGNAGAGGGNGADVDPQTSLTLDPSVIAPNFANDGQDPPVDGQVASLTSTNNFINFCAGKTITDGLQITGGSCNPAPIGDIPSTANMPSAKWASPKNGETIAAGTTFTVQLAIKNLITGNFVNAQKSYFAAPQQLQGGVILGHSHAVIEKLTAFDQITATNPNEFVFFKGLNEAAQGGILSAEVPNGLPAGEYRICSINSSSNHQPVIAPIAQHGSLDDCSYFTVGAGAGEGNGAGGNDAANDDAANDDAANDDAANDDAANTGNNNGGGNGRGGRGRFGQGGGFGRNNRRQVAQARRVIA